MESAPHEPESSAGGLVSTELAAQPGTPQRLAQVDDAQLYAVYARYCAPRVLSAPASAAFPLDVATPGMDATHFARLVRESGACASSAAADVAFAAARGRGERRISFLEFRSALLELAQRSAPGCDADAEARRIEAKIRAMAADESMGPTLRSPSSRRSPTTDL